MTLSLDTIPRDHLALICRYLDPKDMHAMSRTSKCMYEWSEEAAYWRNATRIEFPQKYHTCYGFLSSQISFARIYALEKLCCLYKTEKEDLGQIKELSLASLHVDVILMPFVATGGAAVVSMALFGTATAIHEAVQTGIFNGSSFNGLKQSWNKWYHSQ